MQLCPSCCTCLGCGPRQRASQALGAARPAAAACRHAGSRQLARVQSRRQLAGKSGGGAVRQLHHRLLQLVQIEEHLGGIEWAAQTVVSRMHVPRVHSQAACATQKDSARPPLMVG